MKAKASHILAVRYVCMGRRHPENFKVALGIMLNIQKNNGKLDSDLDNVTRQLWVYRLVGLDYIRKELQNYVLTEKGKDELRRHNEHKTLISA